MSAEGNSSRVSLLTSVVQKKRNETNSVFSFTIPILLIFLYVGLCIFFILKILFAWYPKRISKIQSTGGSFLKLIVKVYLQRFCFFKSCLGNRSCSQLSTEKMLPELKDLWLQLFQ